MTPIPAIVVRPARSRRSRSISSGRRPIGLRDEHVDLARVEDVEVERDVGRVGAGERPVERVVDPVPLDELDLRRIEIPRTDERRVLCRDTPPSSSMRNGIPHRFPDGDVSGVFRSPCASIQTTAEPVDSPRQPRRRPDVRAAAPAQHDRPSRQRLGDRLALLVERVPLDDRDLRDTAARRRRLGHALAAVAPRRRNAHEPCGERPPAPVALVAVADRDRRERPAVRTASTQRAHATSISYSSKRSTTRMPTDS